MLLSPPISPPLSAARASASTVVKETWTSPPASDALCSRLRLGLALKCLRTTTLSLLVLEHSEPVGIAKLPASRPLVPAPSNEDPSSAQPYSLPTRAESLSLTTATGASPATRDFPTAAVRPLVAFSKRLARSAAALTTETAGSCDETFTSEVEFTSEVLTSSLSTRACMDGLSCSRLRRSLASATLLPSSMPPSALAIWSAAPSSSSASLSTIPVTSSAP